MGVERANKLGFKAKGALSKEFTEVPHFSPVQLLYGKVQQLWHMMIRNTSHNLICSYKKNVYMNSARVFEIFPRFHVAILFQLLIPCCLKMNAIHCQATRLRAQTMANALLKVASVLLHALSPASQPRANVGVGSGHPLGKVHYSSCWE